jgi:general secretion pathway protein D
VSALQIIPALRPLLPTWGNLAAYPPSNAIVISGSADNVQRIADIVAEVDTPSANGIDVVHLNNAVATDLVNELNQLILAARANGAATNASLSADQQSNSILISGDATSRLSLKVLAAKLDSEDALSGNDNTQVIYLHYIQVKDLLPILKGMVHQSVSYSLSSGNAAASSSSNSSSTSLGSNLGQVSSQFSAAASTQIDNATLNGGTSDPKATITIVGDVTNNALVLTAPPTTMMQLKNVIGDLDVAPQQVLVEAIVAQVDNNTMQQLGIQWGSANPTAALANGAPYAFAGGGMGVGFIEAADFTTLIEALSSDTHSNILSTPSVTVLNNSPANIQVGENIFQQTGTYSPTDAGGGVVTQFQQQQVGLSLNVIPQVTGQNSIRLIIDQTNSAVLPGTTGGNNVPTSAEQISTQVMVNNGQILVLGGLLQGTEQETVDKVPFLGDIPVIGYLFRSYKTSIVKKDLMIFLRPVVLTTVQQNTLTLNRYDFMRDVAILNANQQGDLITTSILPSRIAPTIPAPFDDSSTSSDQ